MLQECNSNTEDISRGVARWPGSGRGRGRQLMPRGIVLVRRLGLRHLRPPRPAGNGNRGGLLPQQHKEHQLYLAD